MINLPLGLVGIWLTLRHAPQAAPTQPRGLDLAGQILAALALVSIVGALTQASTFGWTSPWIEAGLVVGALLFISFLVVEARINHPMMPLGLFENATFSTATYVGIVANFVFYGLVFVFSLFFQVVQGKTALATGLAFVPMTGFIAAVNVAAGRLIGRFGIRVVMLSGLFISSVGYAAMLLIDASTTFVAIAPIFALAGIGMALTVPSVMTAALAGTGLGQAGIAAGVLNSARQVGGAAGVALFGSAIGLAGPDKFVSGLHISVALAIVALLSALFATLFFVPRQATTTSAHAGRLLQGKSKPF